MTNPNSSQPYPSQPHPNYGYGQVQQPHPRQVYTPPAYLNNVASGEYGPPRDSMTTFQRPVNHVLHGILTVLTGGLWGIVWLCVAFSHPRPAPRP